MGGCGREKASGDWYYLFFPEVEKIESEKPKSEEVEFKVPECCDKEMIVVLTDSGDPYWVCEMCLESKEVE